MYAKNANTTILATINRIEAANVNLNVEASAKSIKKKRCKWCITCECVSVLCCVVLCASVFSNVISHTNLQRTKLFCAFRLHDYCGIQCTVYTTIVSMCVCVHGCLIFLFLFSNVFVSSFLSFRSTSLSNIHYGLSISLLYAVIPCPLHSSLFPSFLLFDMERTAE